MKKYQPLFTFLAFLFGALSNGQTNFQLKKTIDSLYTMDQKVQWVIKDAWDNQLPMDSIQKLDIIKKQTFERAIPVVKAIYAKYGYPTIKLVGKESSSNYFIIIQHSDSDLAFQATMLPILERLSKKGEISRVDYAMLYDRVQRNSGKMQLYGTQLSFDGNGNLFDSTNKIILPKDLYDPKNVDSRRKKMNLKPIETYYEETLEALGRPRKK